MTFCKGYVPYKGRLLELSTKWLEVAICDQANDRIVRAGVSTDNTAAQAAEGIQAGASEVPQGTSAAPVPWTIWRWNREAVAGTEGRNSCHRFAVP